MHGYSIPDNERTRENPNMAKEIVFAIKQLLSKTPFVNGLSNDDNINMTT